MVVNGHVPVKWEIGESPVKKGGKAVIIDGAFSEAYGDKVQSTLLSRAAKPLWYLSVSKVAHSLDFIVILSGLHHGAEAQEHLHRGARRVQGRG
jgi:fructose-bisphosphate aldolase class 1